MINMSKFSTFFEGEDIVLEQSVWYAKNLFIAKTGTIIVTSKRIAFIEQKQVIGGGVLVAVADAAFKVSNPKLKVDILFNDLDYWTNPKKNDITFLKKSGERYNFRPVEYSIWNAELEKLTSKKGK